MEQSMIEICGISCPLSRLLGATFLSETFRCTIMGHQSPCRETNSAQRCIHGVSSSSGLLQRCSPEVCRRLRHANVHIDLRVGKLDAHLFESGPLDGFQLSTLYGYVLSCSTCSQHADFIKLTPTNSCWTTVKMTLLLSTAR